MAAAAQIIEPIAPDMPQLRHLMIVYPLCFDGSDMETSRTMARLAANAHEFGFRSDVVIGLRHGVAAHAGKRIAAEVAFTRHVGV